MKNFLINFGFPVLLALCGVAIAFSFYVAATTYVQTEHVIVCKGKTYVQVGEEFKTVFDGDLNRDYWIVNEDVFRLEECTSPIIRKR